MKGNMLNNPWRRAHPSVMILSQRKIHNLRTRRWSNNEKAIPRWGTQENSGFKDLRKMGEIQQLLSKRLVPICVCWVCMASSCILPLRSLWSRREKAYSFPSLQNQAAQANSQRTAEQLRAGCLGNPEAAFIPVEAKGLVVTQLPPYSSFTTRPCLPFLSSFSLMSMCVGVQF